MPFSLIIAQDREAHWYTVLEVNNAAERQDVRLKKNTSQYGLRINHKQDWIIELDAAAKKDKDFLEHIKNFKSDIFNKIVTQILVQNEKYDDESLIADLCKGNSERLKSLKKILGAINPISLGRMKIPDDLSKGNFKKSLNDRLKNTNPNFHPIRLAFKRLQRLITKAEKIIKQKNNEIKTNYWIFSKDPKTLERCSLYGNGINRISAKTLDLNDKESIDQLYSECDDLMYGRTMFTIVEIGGDLYFPHIIAGGLILHPVSQYHQLDDLLPLGTKLENIENDKNLQNKLYRILPYLTSTVYRIEGLKEQQARQYMQYFNNKVGKDCEKCITEIIAACKAADIPLRKEITSTIYTLVNTKKIDAIDDKYKKSINNLRGLRKRLLLGFVYLMWFFEKDFVYYKAHKKMLINRPIEMKRIANQLEEKNKIDKKTKRIANQLEKNNKIGKMLKWFEDLLFRIFKKYKENKYPKTIDQFKKMITSKKISLNSKNTQFYRCLKNYDDKMKLKTFACLQKILVDCYGNFKDLKKDEARDYRMHLQMYIQLGLSVKEKKIIINKEDEDKLNKVFEKFQKPNLRVVFKNIEIEENKINEVAKLQVPKFNKKSDGRKSNIKQELKKKKRKPKDKRKIVKEEKLKDLNVGIGNITEKGSLRGNKNFQASQKKILQNIDPKSTIDNKKLGSQNVERAQVFKKTNEPICKQGIFSENKNRVEKNNSVDIEIKNNTSANDLCDVQKIAKKIEEQLKKRELNFIDVITKGKRSGDNAFAASCREEFGGGILNINPGADGIISCKRQNSSLPINAQVKQLCKAIEAMLPADKSSIYINKIIPPGAENDVLAELESLGIKISDSLGPNFKSNTVPQMIKIN